MEQETRKPACIIVDLDLPDGGGNELLEQRDGIPVLALIKERSLKRQAEAIRIAMIKYGWDAATAARRVDIERDKSGQDR